MILRKPDETFWVWRYHLKSRRALNSKRPQQVHPGALIRYGGGYANLHPWPELGDPTLEKCLADLTGDRRWGIVRRAVRCMAMDAEMRIIGESLWTDMDVPFSHATLPGPDRELWEQARSSGFTHVKLKCGVNLNAERNFLMTCSQEDPVLRWRLDFNESQDPSMICDWLHSLPSDIRHRIDFVEDPSPYSDTAWRDIYQKTKVQLAVDRESAPNQKAAHVMILKPAIDEPWLLAEAALKNQQRLVVTSYMDHPVGQAFAAWEAALLQQQFPGCLRVCGLQTHHLFEPDLFTEALGHWGPRFQAPEGTGIGFDDILEALPWTPLS